MNFTIVQDSREQVPLVWPEGQAVEVGTLATADYSLKGLTELIAVEKKETGDLISSISTDRERFVRELQRLRAYRCRAIVALCSLEDIIQHKYRSSMAPEAVIGSLAAFQVRYELPIVFCGSADGASRYVLAMFRNFYKQCAEFAKQFNQE